MTVLLISISYLYYIDFYRLYIKPRGQRVNVTLKTLNFESIIKLSKLLDQKLGTFKVTRIHYTKIKIFFFHNNIFIETEPRICKKLNFLNVR